MSVFTWKKTCVDSFRHTIPYSPSAPLRGSPPRWKVGQHSLTLIKLPSSDSKVSKRDDPRLAVRIVSSFSSTRARTQTLTLRRNVEHCDRVDGVDWSLVQLLDQRFQVRGHFHRLPARLFLVDPVGQSKGKGRHYALRS